jgi:hypothetical protein
MKKIWLPLLLAMLVSSQLFPQVSLKQYINDWKSTKADLKRIYGADKVNETAMKDMTFVYYKDKLNNVEVDVTYIYDAKGKLKGKMLKNSVENKAYYTTLLKEVLSICGNNFKKSRVKKYDVYTWYANAPVSVSLIQTGSVTQLVCNKK